jgi:HD-like signal output (HDOD) protein
MHLAQELVASQDHLATLPDLYYKIRRALSNPELSVSELADLIANDPSLAATLLHIANSAFYGFPRKIETLSRAISLIGMEQVGEIVLAGTLAAAFQGIRPQRMDMARFWRGSIRHALLCREFARQQGDRDAERSFIIGLLADMGHLLMYQTVPDLMGIVLDMPATDLLEVAAQERCIIGCDYSEVGAALAAAWQLPPSIGTVLGSQLHPALGGELAGEAARLNLALSVSATLEQATPITAACPLLHPDTAALSGVDLALLPVFAEHCESQLESVMLSLGLR